MFNYVPPIVMDIIKLSLFVVTIFCARLTSASHAREIIVSPNCDSQFSSCATLAKLPTIQLSIDLSIVLLPGAHSLSTYTFDDRANFRHTGRNNCYLHSP